MSERGIGDNFPPQRIVPERLVDVGALEAVLAENYGALVARQAELEAGLSRWIEQHLVPPPPNWPEDKHWPMQFTIHDEADNHRSSEFWKMLATFAGGKAGNGGEVDEARQRVKATPWEACKLIDGWFNGLRTQIRHQMEVIDEAQNDYVRRKEQAVRRERQQQAALALAEAERKIAEALASGGDDDKLAEAAQAEEAAAAAQAAATASRADMVRATSALGVTTSVKTGWAWSVTDKPALVLAAAAPLLHRLLLGIPEIAASPAIQKAVADALHLDDPAHQVPLDYLTADETTINAAVKRKNGRRSCAGLLIEETANVARSMR